MHATHQSDSSFSAEAAILAELSAAPLAAAELKKRVRKKLRLSAADCNGLLDRLVAARSIHGVHTIGKTGRANKAIGTYVLGAPPPPPPAPPAPRELARGVIREVLESGELTTTALQKRIRARLPALSAKDYQAVLTALVAAHEIFGRRRRGASGKFLKAIDSYVLGGAPADVFVAPVLDTWHEMHLEARAAGVTDQALIAALLAGLDKAGLRVVPPASAAAELDERGKVLRGVQTLVAQEGQGALIPIRKLRSALQLPKSRFDSAVLQLYAEDAIILHHHDYVGNLSDAERNDLVLDRHGNYYLGVALRGDH